MARIFFRLVVPSLKDKYFTLSSQPVSGFCGEGTIFGYIESDNRSFTSVPDRNNYNWQPFSDAPRETALASSPKFAAAAVLTRMLSGWRWAVVSFADRVHRGSGLGAVLIDPLEDGEVLTINRIKWKVNKMKPFINPNTRALCQRVELVRVQKEKKA